MNKWTRFGVFLACAGLTAAGAAAEKVQLRYDPLGRLIRTTVTNTTNSNSVTVITYDKAGNRTAYAVSGASGTAPTQPAPSMARTAPATTVAPQPATSGTESGN